MKKIILFILILMLALNSTIYALDSTLMDMRKEIFSNSQEMKAYLKNSKDPILLNSMWDSCIIAVTQLDAYFYIVGIFNTIKKEDLSDASFDYLLNWLNQIKKTNELNIKSLDTVTSTSEPKTKVYILKLKNNFNELNIRIVKELQRVSQFQESTRKRIKR